MRIEKLPLWTNNPTSAYWRGTDGTAYRLVTRRMHSPATKSRWRAVLGYIQSRLFHHSNW